MILDCEFPSPLGEMGLSIWSGAKYCEVSRNIVFPSPLGEMGLSILQSLICVYPNRMEFPSPLGEMGLSIKR